jgi:hypothetical protein
MPKQNPPLAFLVSILVFPAVAAHAVELAPGESADQHMIFYDGPLASDELVMTRSIPFELIGNDTGEAPRFLRGTFENTVYRSRQDGTLSFRYAVVGQDTDGRVIDLEGLTASGFGLFHTDAQIPTPTGLRRSPDGDTLFVSYTDTLSQRLFVRTDATHFADGGLFTYHVSFQPDGRDPTARLAAFRPVPEPASLSLLCFAALSLMRRRTVARP